MQSQRTTTFFRMVALWLLLASFTQGASRESEAVQDAPKEAISGHLADGRLALVHSPASEEPKVGNEEGKNGEVSSRDDEGKEGAEVEEGEEVEEESPVQNAYDISISAMLLGAIAFQMMIFYAVNNRDADIRYYSWSIISCTVSIFTAVLVFSACNHLMHHLLEQETDVVKVAAHYAVLMLWLVVLNVTVLLIAYGKLCGKDRIKINMACWGTLLAHTSGFASIAAGGEVQHLPFIRNNHWMVLATVPLHCGLVFVMFLLTAKCCRCAVSRAGSEVLELWHENVLDAEIDASAIALSFLLVQALRFHISGVLPNSEGLEEPQKSHLWGVLGLASCALLFAIFIVVTLLGSRRMCHSLPHCAHRMLELVQGTSAMGFAWCLFFAAKWQLKEVMPESDPNSMQWRVALAITLSAGAFAFIFVLDKIADLEATGEEVDKAIINIISGLGVLVGFSWEQSFDGAVEHIAEGLLPSSSFSELGLSLLVALVVVPAWRDYILRNMKKAQGTVDAEVRSASFMNAFCSPDKPHAQLLPGAASPVDNKTRNAMERFDDGEPLRRDLLKRGRRHTENLHVLRDFNAKPPGRCPSVDMSAGLVE